MTIVSLEFVCVDLGVITMVRGLASLYCACFDEQCGHQTAWNHSLALCVVWLSNASSHYWSSNGAAIPQGAILSMHQSRTTKTQIANHLSSNNQLMTKLLSMFESKYNNPD
jgi:hypothetical protein